MPLFHLDDPSGTLALSGSASLSGSGFTVLMVEDNPGDRRLLELLLVEAGVGLDRIRHVSDLQSALARADEGSFSVILLDLNLPDSDGLETLTRIRAAVPGIPVVVMTGHLEGPLAYAAVQDGAQDFLVKGRVDGWMLCRTLGLAIERHHLQTARGGSNHGATHDRLTGLPNWTLFDDRLAHAIAGAARFNSRVAVVCLQVEELSSVNARFGGRAGDLILIESGRRLSAAVRNSDTVARLVGSGFGVLFENLPDWRTGLVLAQQLLTGLQQPVALPGGHCTTDTSMGVASYPEEATEVGPLLLLAETRRTADRIQHKGPESIDNTE